MTASFSDPEREALLKLKGVGQTVIARLEQIGISSFHELQQQDASVLTKQISDMMGSTCWHNSPIARIAIKSAIDLAKEHSS
jgi:nucleotidyltransferase/DNA polymerase involved in DNA repair